MQNHASSMVGVAEQAAKRWSMSNQPEETFLQKHFEYYQAWHHWLGKAVKLKRAALILYRADLPDLRLYDKAYKKAEKEVGDEGKALIRRQTSSSATPSFTVSTTRVWQTPRPASKSWRRYSPGPRSSSRV